MFELESALREWRKTGQRYSLTATDLDELEDHLYSSYLVQVDRGIVPAEAFAKALRALGSVEQVSSEYRKVRSTTWLRLLKASWAAFALAFFLPVVEGGITLSDPNLREGILPGLQAIRAAWADGGWSTFSALTNVVMLATMWRVSALGRSRTTVLAAVAVASVFLNGLWLTELNALSELRPGYYLWWTSFGLASGGLLLRARSLWQTTTKALLA